MLKQLSQIIFAISALIFVGVASFIAFQFLSIRETEIRNTAVQECLTLSTHTRVDEETSITTVEPIEPVYIKCLSLKNL